MAAPTKRAIESQEEVPTKVSTQTAKDAKLKGFIQWCNERGFSISPKVM